jgi:hypothetical protein
LNFKQPRARILAAPVRRPRCEHSPSPSERARGTPGARCTLEPDAMRYSAGLVHQDFRSSGQEPAFRTRCGLVYLHFAMVITSITKITGPRRVGQGASGSRTDASDKVRPPRDATSIGRPYGVASRCQWQGWRRYVPPVRRTSLMLHRRAPHLRRPPHPAPQS